MKSKEVLNLLQITRQTLTKYIKDGKIKVRVLHNGRYDYDQEDVYKLYDGTLQRQIVIYGRVSTNKQKKDLENQLESLKQFCFMNGWSLGHIYKDIASGISFEKRKDFFEMLDAIIDRKIEKVVISYKDRLSRVGFELFKHLFKKYDCEIVVMSEVGSEKLDSEEIFEEIIGLLHCYSMKLYSNRKNKVIEELVKPCK